MKPIFSWREWCWTEAGESLFTLTKEELYLFRLIIKEAS
jgi:hypothetical protein